MWTWNHLQLEGLEIQRKLVYYLRYDNSGHTPFSLSGPEICSLDCTIQQNLYSSDHQYDSQSIQFSTKACLCFCR